ncbi:hypothetical protein BACPEC_02770 [[Bacteroides] pectinophilus ATCC 43243]|jgi:SPX domain protein involved in polyphosphate accumulation|uniref:Uncharacterized protein n=1 Tax=[Bacteroides] pectinophilus ATCC 43243 TaxID=483218 RepID=B7AVM2_9FIRM|nr:hypothetical protein BACPEC_02770 [[Bacteroides] pectinophilus ATCC 43243]HBH93239.1 hypothetical protein [Bacteroides sp.]
MRFTKHLKEKLEKEYRERYEKEFRERYDKDCQQQRQQHQQDADLIATLKAEIERLRKLLAQQSS